MKDRRLNSNGEIEEWERPRTIPDDFIYHPETNSYYPPGEPSEFDVEVWIRDFREEMNNLSEEERGKGLISVDQLRAAGALDVPPAWRKSLGGEEDRDLFSDLPEDEENTAKQRHRKLTRTAGKRTLGARAGGCRGAGWRSGSSGWKSPR